MPKTAPFDTHHARYEDWFAENRPAYEAELALIRPLLAPLGDAVEIGVGTGRFAKPLGIRRGVEPSAAMAARAAARGIETIDGTAEALPLDDASVDTALMVTTICFVDDVRKSFAEVRRVLRPDGKFVLAFVDRASPLGKTYLAKQADNPFYAPATFFSTQELLDLLVLEGFQAESIRQTLFDTPDSPERSGRSEDGHGTGGFVAIRARLG